MMQDLIKLFLFIAILVLFYQCIRKGRRRALRQQSNNSFASAREEDLRRFRERMSERGGGGAVDANSATAIAARKELIEKNLFSREIRREESVRELQQLLAISRGGEVDEELGECRGGGSQLPTYTKKPGMEASPSESSLPAPSAPPSPEEAARPAPQAQQPSAGAEAPPSFAFVNSQSERPIAPPSVDSNPFNPLRDDTSSSEHVDTIAVAIASQTDQPQQNPAANPVSLEPVLEPIRNLWNNLTHGTERRASERAAPANETGGAETCATRHKLECSICLEEYKAGDTVAWAKDGGDAPSASNAAAAINNSDRGCDHLFHKGCLAAWLEENDECPLCRRKVVHADADVRFGGWEM